MDQRNLRIIPFSVAILGVSLIIGTLIVSAYFYKVKALSDVVSVTGSSQKIITSDVVKWRASITRQAGADGLAHANEAIQGDLTAAQRFLKDHGVADSQVTITPVAVNPNYNYNKMDGGNNIAGYTLTQNITVESNEVDKITKLAQDAGALISEGINFSSQPLEYYYSKLADLKVEMLGEATKDAQARAKKIVESAGAGLGAIKSASMGVMQITPVNSQDISDYGYYDTTSIQKQIQAVVRASFSVN